MKNIISLSSKADIHEFVRDLWKSPMFRKSYDERGYIYQITDRFAWLPRIFAETKNDYLERAHFATWWNVIMLRDDYDNPVISDLYYLHEMTHAMSMPYVPGIGRAAFDEKMQRNELEASVLSEIAIYLAMPGLRQNSFDHTIYADRFLTSKMENLWEANQEVALEILRTARRDVMVSKPEHLMDESEIWIRRYSDQNTAYGVVWSDRYDEVETHMADLQTITAAGGRKEALEAYMGWLMEEAGRDRIDGIPFRLEAELFSPFYWANKQKYKEAMSAKKLQQAA